MFGLRVLLFAGLAAAAAGCGKSAPSAVLHGTVSYKGQLLKAGSMNFFSDSGMYEAPVRADGTYKLTDLPLVEFVVTVDTHAFDPDQKAPSYANAMTKKYAKGMNSQYSEYNKTSGGGQFATPREEAGDPSGLTPEQRAELAKKFTKIPVKYANRKTSPLQYTMRGGDNVWNIELTD